jgi:hypothetical protein
MSEMKLGIVFDVQNGRFKNEVKENTTLIQKLGTTHQTAAGKSRQLGNELTTTEQKLFRTNKVAQAVTLSLASMATGFSVGLLVKNLSDTTQKFQVLRATLETATGGVDEAGLAFDRLQVFASRTPFSVEESIQAFIKLKNLGLDPSEAALNSYGNTASAMGKSLDQFIEAVADASVSEFERLKEFGIKAKNQGDTIAFTFRKMKTEVANNAEAIEQYLQNLGENEFAGAMERQAATYDGALSNMGDSWDQLLLKISENGVGDAMENVVRGITTNLDLLGNSTDEIATVFQVGLVVAAGHVVNALSNKTAAIIKDTVATRAAATADVLRANAEIKLATTARITAQTSLQAAAAETRLTAARTLLTTATARLSVGTRILSGSMALLGGPVGVALLGAYALYELAGAMNETKSGADQLSESLGTATKSITDMTRAEQLSTQASYRKLITEKKVAIDELDALAKKQTEQSKNNAGPNSSAAAGISAWATSGQADEARKELENLKNALSDVEGALFDAGMAKINWNKVIVNGAEVSETKTPPEQDSKVLDVYAQQEEALSRQLALLGETTQLAKAEYETTKGKYKDLLPGQKAALLNLAQEIDAKNKSLALDDEAISQATQLKNAADSYADSLQKKGLLTSESSNVAQLNYEIEHGSLKGINDELRTQLELLAQKADATAALGEQQLPFWEQMKEHISSTSQDFDTMWGNTFNSFAQNMGDAVSTSIMEGQNFGDTMKSIARSAIKEVISGLVQIGVKKLALSAIEKVIGTTGAATNVALAATTGTAMAASYAPAAAFASLASFGANAVPASAGIATTFALTEGLALAGMAHDGIDEIPSEGTWLLDKGERVVDNRTNQDLKQYLNKTQSGGSAPIINLTNNFVIEGNGNSNADIESAINLSTEKMRADLYEDFSTNGALTQQLKASM